MTGIAGLQGRYGEQKPSQPLRALPEFDEGGLTLGRGSRLARGDSATCFDGDVERLAVLLSEAYGLPVPPRVMDLMGRAADHWRRGDKALAHIVLAHARLPRLDAEDDAFRLFLAETLLDDGMSPRELARVLGYDWQGAALRKYDPGQPRVPAGNGVESGRFAPGSGSDDSPPASSVARGNGARLSFLVGATPGILRTLATFASRFSVPTAVLGALIIPTPNDGGVTDGTLPDAPDIRYRRDGPAGTLRLARARDDGGEAVVVAQNRGGVVVDVATDEPLGRDLGGQLYLDLAAVTAALAPRARPAAADEGPQLYPAPMPDTPHGASEAAKAFEDDVHARVNPLLPLPRGFGVKVVDPLTGRYVFFDDCFRYAGDLVDGDMRAGDLVEAKGPRTAFLYGQGWAGALGSDVTQAEKELRAARARGVGLKWYFAEEGAAMRFRERLEKKKIDGIVVGVLPQGRRRRCRSWAVPCPPPGARAAKHRPPWRDAGWRRCVSSRRSTRR